MIEIWKFNLRPENIEKPCPELRLIFLWPRIASQTVHKRNKYVIKVSAHETMFITPENIV